TVYDVNGRVAQTVNVETGPGYSSIAAWQLLWRRPQQETTMAFAWFAQRLQVGSVNTLKNTLRFINSRDPFLGEACAKSGWHVHAYVLMPNHFHLVVETPQPNLVAGMKWFLGTYTSRLNRRHQLFGHLFSGRSTSLSV